MFGFVGHSHWGSVSNLATETQLCDKGEGLHCVLNFWHGQRSFVAVPNSSGSKTVTVHRGQWLCPVTNCSSHGCCREEEETHLIP